MLGGRIIVRSVDIMHAGGQGGTVRAHETGDVRAGDLAFGEQFESAQHGIVEEGAALDDDRVAERVGVTQFDDLVQCVAHDRIAQAGGDVLDGGALFLRLFDGGVHEHGATRAQIYRMCGVQGFLREFLDAQPHGLGESLQEGPTAGRAGLVDGNRVDNPVGDGEVFHVLTADIDDGRHTGADHFGTAVMRHRFDNALIQMQTSGNQAFAVAGRTRTRNPRFRRQLSLDAFDDIHGGGQRTAFVRGVGGPYDFAVVVDEGRLDGGRTRVDAKEVRAGRPFERAHMHVFAMVTGIERLAVRLGGEQWRHGLRIARQVLQSLQIVKNLRASAWFGDRGGACVVIVVVVVAGDERGTKRDIQMGVARGDELVDLAFERTVEGFAQLGHEEQRPAEKDDVAVDWPAGSKTRDCLRGDGGEDRSRQIGFRRAVVDERLQIGFREHTATRSDRVQGLVMLGHFVEAGRIRIQQGGHLVDECAGAARARTVHALLRGGLQIRDFRILATEFDDDVGLRDFLVNRAGFGDDFLDEGHVDVVGERQAAGAGDCEPNRLIPASELVERSADVLKQPSHCGADVGVMAPIIGEQHIVKRVALIEHDRLDRGRSDVETDTQRFPPVFAGHDMFSLFHHLHLISIVGGVPGGADLKPCTCPPRRISSSEC